MGFFFPDATPNSDKKLHFRDLDTHLRKVSGLTSNEREFILGKFDEHRDGHINKREAEKVLKDLRIRTDDGITREKAQRVHQTLMDYYDAPAEHEDHE